MAIVHFYNVDVVDDALKVTEVGDPFRVGMVGGDATANYKRYIEGKKYMMYCDVAGDLVIHSFSVNIRGISPIIGAKCSNVNPRYPIDGEAPVDGIEAIVDNPGFPKRNALKGNVDAFYMSIIRNPFKDKNGIRHDALNNPKTRAYIAMDEFVADEVVRVIEEYMRAHVINPSYIAMSDTHGNVAAFMIGYHFASYIQVIDIGDCVNKKANYYVGEDTHGAWDLGYYSDLDSCYISSIIYQTSMKKLRKLIHLHGNHDYNINYPTLLLIIKPKYQLWFSHGLINPERIGEIAEVIPTTEIGHPDYERVVTYDVTPDMHLLYLQDDVRSKFIKQDRFKNRYDMGDKTMVNYGDERTWRYYHTLSLRGDLTYSFFHPAFRRGDISKNFSSLPADVEASMENMIRRYLHGGTFNPIFTFGHDMNYEIMHYAIDDAVPAMTQPIYINYDKMVENRRDNSLLKSRVFGVDGAQRVGDHITGGATIALTIVSALILLVIVIVVIITIYKNMSTASTTSQGTS